MCESSIKCSINYVYNHSNQCSIFGSKLDAAKLTAEICVIYSVHGPACRWAYGVTVWEIFSFGKSVEVVVKLVYECSDK